MLRKTEHSLQFTKSVKSEHKILDLKLLLIGAKRHDELGLTVYRS